MLNRFKDFFKTDRVEIKTVLTPLPSKFEDNKVEILAKGSKSHFWTVLKQYIDSSLRLEVLLAVKDEKKFMYMKGYMKALTDIKLQVQIAVKRQKVIDDKESKKTIAAQQN